MNKFFTKVAIASVGVAMAIGVGVAVSSARVGEVKAADPQTETFSHSDISGMATAAAASTSGTYSVFTITVDGIASSGYNASESVRVYKGAAITISTSSGNITSATVTCTANGTTKYGPGCLTGDGYSAGTAKTGTWTGEAASFTLTASSNQARISDFSITYVPAGEVTTYTIQYDANGGSGEMEDTVSANPAVAACTFTPPEGRVFERWNTSHDGGGDDYAVGATPGDDLYLFAIWMDAPTCVTLTNIGADLGSEASADLQTVDVNDSLTSETYTLNYVQCKKYNNAMLMTKSVNPLISNHTAIPGSISSVEVFINNGASASTTYDVAFGTTEFTTATAGIGAVNITGGSSHVFTNGSVDGATYFCITLGNANNGQVLGITINYEEADPVDPTLDPLYVGQVQTGSITVDTSFTVGYSKTSNIYTFSAFAVEDPALASDSIKAINWVVGDPTVISVDVSDGSARVTTLKPGSTTLKAVHSASEKLYNDATVTLTVTKGWLEGITISGSMSKTSYTNHDDWDPTGLVVTASYHYNWEEVITSGISWSYSPAKPEVGVTEVYVSAYYEEGGYDADADADPQSVTVAKVNGIQALYSKSSGESVDVYGYYVGFLDGTGPVIMDGEYGIVVYNSSADVSGYTPKETILHVTGSISIYKGLYEIGSSTISVASGEYDTPDTPVVYSTNGSETAEYASRLTTVTGTATLTSGNFDDAAGTNDIKMNFSVGGKTVQVFYKKAAQTADADAFNAIKDAVANSTEITIKGFTGWYNGFQVQMNGYVPAAEGYTAEDFAQDLLDQTDAVCTGYKDGDNNHDAIEAIWSDLASDDKYPSLPAAEKTILAEAERDESGSVVEQAMARYDYLTGKYNLSNFINGRTPVAFVNGGFSYNDANNNISLMVVIAITSFSVIGFTTLLVIKRRKHN